MRYTVIGKNIEITEGIKEAITAKLSKLDKYFKEDTIAKLTLSVQKDEQKIEVTIPTKHRIIRAEQSSNDMYVAIDLISDIIEKQIKKYKNKLIDKKHNSHSFSEIFMNETSENIEDEGEIKILKFKKFDIKPMTAEEACLQMEMLGHNFYVFVNSDTEQTAVVYKRKNNSYGLIEAEF